MDVLLIEDIIVLLLDTITSSSLLYQINSRSPKKSTISQSTEAEQVIGTSSTPPAIAGELDVMDRKSSEGIIIDNCNNIVYINFITLE